MTFDETLVEAVWEKGRATANRDSTEWRQDQCGAWLNRRHYNNGESEYGWKILNVVAGGADEPENLQPFHWRNGFDLANGRAQCRVTADRSGLAPGQQVLEPRNTVS